MSLPRFAPGDDPGPSFAALLRRVGDPDGPVGGYNGSTRRGVGVRGGLFGSGAGAEVPHGTTCVALRYDGGVVLAGDRRATAGNFISHHRIEKVFQADSHSGVAIAGVAGPAAEMVRLFQLQLEHYEKVEGTPISLEGKANQLSQMVRANLPSAMQGLVVVPVFAGFDLAEGTGRIFEYDITGGRYEERSHAATGSGSMHAATAIRLGMRAPLTLAGAVSLALEALLVAAEADSATGGPDPRRGIFPVVAVIGSDGYRRIDDDELRLLTESLLERLTSRGTREVAS